MAKVEACPTVVEIADAVRAGRRRAIDVLEERLLAIDAANPTLNAFVHLDVDAARRAATAVDAAVASGHDPGPFAGVPIGVKDLEDCAGMPTSHGSLLFKGGSPAAHDSIHVARLRAAGAVPVGKTAAPEFGATCFTSTKAWGTTRNPWDPARTPGGSSGGSAAAVAAGMVPACTASDGGGSTRIPAAFSGLVGFKPTYGRIPHESPSPSMTSTYGLLTTTVRDAARHLDVVAGPHERDRASLPPPAVRYEDAIESLDVRGLRALWTVDQGFAVVDEEVAAVAEDAARALVAAAELRLVEREVHLTDPLRTWLGAGCLDMWLDIGRDDWPARAGDLTGLVRSSFERMQDMQPAQVARTFERRNRLGDDLAAIFDDVDVIISPTTAMPAFAAEGPLPFALVDGRPAPAGPTPLTMVFNLCWNPAVSVPAGTTGEGLPVGLQIAARRHVDEIPLRLARLLEQARPWPRHAPSVEGPGQG